MTLQASGLIKFSDIQNEFGGTNPISLSEYVRGGGLVPDAAENSSIPTTNSNIQMSDFYNTSSWSTDRTETVMFGVAELQCDGLVGSGGAMGGAATVCSP